MEFNLQRLLEDFLETLDSQNTKSAYGGDLKEFCKGKTLSEVNNGEYITIFLSQPENRRWQRKLYSLRSFFSYLVKLEEINSTPIELESFNGYKPSRKKGIIVSINQVINAINHELNVKHQFSYRNAALISVMSETCLKINEIIQLQWSDLKGNRLYCRKLPFILSIETIEYLSRLKGISSFIFLTKNLRPMSRCLTAKIIKEAQEDSDVKFTSRDLQFTFIYRKWKSGASVDELQNLLGHSHKQTTWRFIQDFKEVEEHIKG